MTETQPYHHDDGTPWSSDELTAELRNRDLPVGGNMAARRERLEADDAGDPELDVKESDNAPELTDAAKADLAERANNKTTVGDQWRRYKRADGSLYLVGPAYPADAPAAENGGPAWRRAPEDEAHELLDVVPTP